MGLISFLNGAFLFALGAAALPILIHFLSRRRARTVQFSHLRFLDEITRRKVRRMRLRQWLLLALRTLAIVLIALALSRPVWRGPGASARRGSSTVAILIDDSFSMEARTDPGAVLPIDVETSGLQVPTRFALAQQRAREVVDLLEEGDRALLIFMGAPLRVPYESTVHDPALLTAELERARPRPVRADLGAALEYAQPILSAAKTLNREIFIISDFQSTQAEELVRRLGAAAQQETTATAARARALLPVAEQTRVYWLPVSERSTPNVALVGAQWEADPAGAGGRLAVHLRNVSATPVREAVIEVRAGSESGRILAEGYVSAEAQAIAQTTIAVPEIPADRRLVVRIAPDALERDNTRYVDTGTASRFKILVVTGGEIRDERIRDEVRFAILAIDPWRGLNLLAPAGAPVGEADSAQVGPLGAPLFEVATVPETDLGLNGGIDADAVVLLNVGRLSPAAVELLASFQKDGGGILMALGDRVDVRMYNTQILPELGGLRLGDVQGELTADAHFTLRPAVTGHEIFEGFPISPGGALTGARFQRIVGLHPGPVTRVLAEFSGGYPALVEEPGLLLFASSLDSRWSDFPTSASYLPFLHRALLHLVLGGHAARREPLVGEPLSWPLPRDAGREALHCMGPLGSELPLEIVQTERGPVLRSGPVPLPGFYDVRDGQLPGFAVNVDVRESDLTPMGPEVGGLLFGEKSIRLGPDQPLSRQVLATRYGRELWRLCLALAFALLLAETLIARGRTVA